MKVSCKRQKNSGQKRKQEADGSIGQDMAEDIIMHMTEEAFQGKDKTVVCSIEINVSVVCWLSITGIVSKPIG